MLICCHAQIYSFEYAIHSYYNLGEAFPSHLKTSKLKNTIYYELLNKLLVSDAALQPMDDS